MADQPRYFSSPSKHRRNEESDSASEAGAERTQVRPEVAKSAQVDARGMQEVENTRTNKHSGSASELEWNKGNRGNGDRGSGRESGKNFAGGGIDGKGDKSGKSNKDGGDGDSITIEAVDESGKKFTVASRVSGGTERDFLAKGDKGEGARGAPVERGQKGGEAKELVREDLTASARELVEKPQERFQTREMKAIQSDQSLPAEKRVLAEQLQQMRSKAKEANQPTDEIDRFATEAFKDDICNMRGSDADEAGTFQAISDVSLAQGTLPTDANGAVPTVADLTESAAPTDATAPQIQSQSQTRHLDEDGRPIVDHQAEQLDKKTFSLGLSYEEGTPPPQNETMEKMSRFFQAATHRAEAFITNPDAQAKYIEEQKEKFIGIGIGLNDAKEAFKTLAGEGWKQLGHGAENLKEGASHLADALSRPADINEAVVKETQAVLKVLAEDPNAVNKALSKGLDDAAHAAQPVVDAGGKMLHDMSENPHYLNDALSKGLGVADNTVLKASNEYSNLPPREKGRVIGLLMFDMINPEGTLEAPTLMAQTAKRGTNAAKEIVQVAASSATVQEAKANLYILEDLVKSDEFKDLLQNGVFEALNIGKQESFAALGPQLDNYNMVMIGDGFFKPIERRWQALTSDLGRIESRFKRYRSDLPSPFEEGLSAQEQHLRAVDWLMERVPEHAEHFDHYTDCRNTLLNHKSPEDLLYLCESDHMIFTPDKMEEVAPKLSNKFAEGDKQNFQDNFPAITFSDDKYTIIPKHRAMQVEFQKGVKERPPKEWILNKTDYDIGGVVRHEIGQALSGYLGWTDRVYENKVLKASYFNTRQSIMQDIDALQTKIGRAMKAGDLEAAAEFRSTEIGLRKFRPYLIAGDYGLEQTSSDLYAIAHGGSANPRIDPELKEKFFEMSAEFIRKNWYRI